MHFETQPCHIVFLDREYLLHVHRPHHVWILLRYSYSYNVMIIFFLGGGGELGAFFWGGKLGVLGGELLSLKYPR